MLVVFGPRFRLGLVRTQRPGLQIARSLTMLAMPVCFVLAASRMPVVDVWSVYWTSPLVALALSTWVLGEGAGRTRWIAVAVGFAGVLMMLHPDVRVLTPAVVLAFGMGLCISLHLMLSRMLRNDHPITSLFYTALWVFVVLSFGVWTIWVVPTTSSLIGMVLIGVIGIVGLYSLARAGELAPLAVVAAFAYSEGLWEMGFGLVFFHIVPGLASIAGALVVAGTIGFLLVYEHRRAPNAP
jgi:drug/metabolite transporter (DMT)-like permease